jgi:hypothetical protein
MNYVIRTFVMCLLCCSTGLAQDRLYRFEVGPTFGLLPLRQIDRNQEIGYGGRVTVNFLSWVAADMQAVHFDRPDTLGNFTNRETQLLGQAKLTYRGLEGRYKLNFFGIAGPGYSWRTLEIPSDPQFGGGRTFSEKGPAFSAGGGIEFLPHDRIAIRADITGVSVRIPETLPSGPFTRFSPAHWWHRAEYQVGVMFRF